MINASILRALPLAAAVLAASSGRAQVAPPADPADAGAPVPRLAYRSPFLGYRAFADTTMTPWRQANDAAAAAGGWRAYAREAQQPVPAAPAASAHHGAHNPPRGAP